MTHTFYKLLAIAGLAFATLGAVSCDNSGEQGALISAQDENSANAELNERQKRAASIKEMPKTTIAFKEASHDFGTATEGEVLKHVYTFTNTGDAPYMISRVETPCGCTEPIYSQKPVNPGEEGTVEVHFNTEGKSGPNQKSVTIFGNTAAEMVVSFTAEVTKK